MRKSVPEDSACGDGGAATKGECLKLLDFTYVNHDYIISVIYKI